MIVIAVLVAMGGVIGLFSRGDNKGDSGERRDNEPDGDRFGGAMVDPGWSKCYVGNTGDA